MHTRSLSRVRAPTCTLMHTTCALIGACAHMHTRMPARPHMRTGTHTIASCKAARKPDSDSLVNRVNADVTFLDFYIALQFCTMSPLGEAGASLGRTLCTIFAASSELFQN